MGEAKFDCLLSGPHRLDLGNILYAPNAFVDGRGRTLMLAWLQELRSGGAYDYAGCLSLPRLLSLQGHYSSVLYSIPHNQGYPKELEITIAFKKAPALHITPAYSS